jgi:hypothetical protein
MRLAIVASLTGALVRGVAVVAHRNAPFYVTSFFASSLDADADSIS